MNIKQNWEWVRTTYSPLTCPRQNGIDEEPRFPSCVANGLSKREKKALMKVFDAAYQRAAAQRAG